MSGILHKAGCCCKGCPRHAEPTLTVERTGTCFSEDEFDLITEWKVMGPGSDGRYWTKVGDWCRMRFDAYIGEDYIEYNLTLFYNLVTGKWCAVMTGFGLGSVGYAGDTCVDCPWGGTTPCRGTEVIGTVVAGVLSAAFNLEGDPYWCGEGSDLEGCTFSCVIG